MKLTAGLRRQHCRGGPHEVRANQVPTCLLSPYLRIPLEVHPGSVRQRRVVHAPPADDYEPEVKATKDQNQLHDIVKRFGNARSNSNHMKELKA